MDLKTIPNLLFKLIIINLKFIFVKRFIKCFHEQGQTLYSFRHTGAIEIFKRTGFISKLQKAIGHSSINVSLTYLRGLEIADLKEEDMPMV